MSVFGKIFAVIMWIVIVICIFCAIYSAIGASFLESLSVALSNAIKDVAWGWWLVIAVCAYALGCLLAPESMAAITDRVAGGLVHLANSAARVVRGIISAAASAIPASVWILLAVGVGVWLVSKTGGPADDRPRVVYQKPEDGGDPTARDATAPTGASSDQREPALDDGAAASESDEDLTQKGGSDVLVV